MTQRDRGFASLDLNKRREISSKGGQAAHRQGRAHQWTSEEAREAGRKGGMASHRSRPPLDPAFVTSRATALGPVSETDGSPSGQSD